MRISPTIAQLATKLIRQLPGALQGGGPGKVRSVPAWVRNGATPPPPWFARSGALTRSEIGALKSGIVSRELQRLENPKPAGSGLPSASSALIESTKQFFRPLSARTLDLQRARDSAPALKAHEINTLLPKLKSELHPRALARIMQQATDRHPESSQVNGGAADSRCASQSPSPRVETHPFFTDADTLDACRPGLIRIDQLNGQFNLLAGAVVMRPDQISAQGRDEVMVAMPCVEDDTVCIDSIDYPDGDFDFDSDGWGSDFDDDDSMDSGLSDSDEPELHFSERQLEVASMLRPALEAWKLTTSQQTDVENADPTIEQSRGTDTLAAAMAPGPGERSDETGLLFKNLFEEIRARGGANGLKPTPKTEHVTQDPAASAITAHRYAHAYSSDEAPSSDEAWSSDADSGVDTAPGTTSIDDGFNPNWG